MHLKVINYFGLHCVLGYPSFSFDKAELFELLLLQILMRLNLSLCCYCAACACVIDII